MFERGKLAAKTSDSIQGSSVSRRSKARFDHTRSTVNPILFLQRTVGNQAVEKLLKSGVIQAKLTIGQPGDIYEQEADRVAEQVMRMPDPGTTRRNGVSEYNQVPSIQRVCTECEEELQRQTQNSQLGHLEPGSSSQEELHRQPMEEEEEEEILQTKEESGGTPEVSPAVEAKINSIRSGGQPLPESVRVFFEPRFGRDFSRVRIHTDDQAAESAHRINARAYTVGHHMVFSAGQYAPTTAAGRRLLAHELMHTIQQRGQTVSRQPFVCGAVETCIPDPENRPLLRMAGGGKHIQNCRPAVGHVQSLLNRFFQSGGVDRCEAHHDALRRRHGQPLPADASRKFLIDGARQKIPLVLDCWFLTLTQAVTKGFQAAVFEDPSEWDGKIGDKTWSALDDFESTPTACPFREMGALTPTNSLKIISGPIDSRSCGNVRWPVTWGLTKPSTAGGHVIQHVTRTSNIRDCKGEKFPRKNFDFFEAWSVSAGAQAPPLILDIPPRHDLYFNEELDETRGSVVMTGKARFQEGLTTLPPEFQPDNPDTLAGSLPSTTSAACPACAGLLAPGLFGGTSIVDHNLTFEWDCCPGSANRRTRVTRHAP